MAKLTLVVIGGSAGGLDALTQVISELPDGLPAAIVVVIHTRSDGSSYLPQILARRTSLRVDLAKDGVRLQKGRIYVAPPDFHVLIDRDRLCLSRGPKENGFRPAVDPLFRSAGQARGLNVIGVVLSGGLDDGTYGLQTIKDAGGTTIVQDPEEATVVGMPQSAIRHVKPHHVLGARDIGTLIAHRAGTPERGARAMARRQEPEPQNPAETTEVLDMQQTFGPPTGLTCPDCGGALWELKKDSIVRYRCHVGHQYSSEGLDAEQHETVEGALWSAVRVLEEHAELRRRMAARSAKAGLADVSRGFDASARDSQRQAAAIRELLFRRNTPEPDRDATPRRRTRPQGRTTPRKPRKRTH
jgi:two-component system chemotaxis response regulator CheB